MLRVLKLLPWKHTKPIEVFVLRQPTKKQQDLFSVWGRLAYFSEIAGCEGVMVFLEARLRTDSYSWTKKLGPDSQLELDRLRGDGHRITEGKREWMIESDFQANRATQLQRTLPHEVGHYVQFMELVEFPSAGDGDLRDRLDDRYSQLTVKEKEQFAHRYADEFSVRRHAIGDLPFNPIFNEKQIRADGLDPSWFEAGV